MMYRGVYSVKIASAYNMGLIVYIIKIYIVSRKPTSFVHNLQHYAYIITRIIPRGRCYSIIFAVQKTARAVIAPFLMR